MSCRGCSHKFTLFNKEHACPNCGFSYCNKCLKYKAVVPKLGEKEVKVCGPCYNFYSRKENDKSTKGEYCPPESFMRRLESLENPARPPITLYRQNSRLQKLKAGLNETDLEIADRLEKLKEERKKQPLPSEEEMARRLALLKDEDPDCMAALQSSKKVYLPPDNRSDQEKADGLMQQYFEEKELRSCLPDPSDEIAERLAKLRGTDRAPPTAAGERKISTVETGPTTDTTETFDTMPLDDMNELMAQLEKEMKEDVGQAKSMRGMQIKLTSQKSKEREEEELVDEDEEEVEKTVKKTFEAVALEQKLEEDELEDTDKEEKEEEFPWCIICNEEATIRCIDCDNDLYCNQCFKQGHDEWELKHHKSVPYKPKKKPA